MKFLLSDRASTKINLVNASTQNPEYLRIKVNGGGCNGFKYHIVFTNEKSKEDVVFEKNGAKVVIDNISLKFLIGAELDYIEKLGYQSFTINNPNSKSRCGCGTSFSY